MKRMDKSFITNIIIFHKKQELSEFACRQRSLAYNGKKLSFMKLHYFMGTNVKCDLWWYQNKNFAKQS